MERDMSIRVTTDDLCSCNSCGVKNYTSKFAPNEKPVDVLYDVRIGNMVSHLCPDCLAALSELSVAVLYQRQRKIDTERFGSCVKENPRSEEREC